MTIESAVKQTEDHTFNCIFLDINLNNTENGASIVKLIKDNAKNQNAETPIIICSGNINPIFQEKFKDRFAGFLAKPFERYEITQLIDQKKNTFLQTV